MSSSVIEACNSLMEKVSDKRTVASITAAGNTVMEHILLGVSPAPLGRIPYKPAFKEGRHMMAADLGFHAGPDAPLYTFPIIGGFVGGDAVSVVLALSMHKKKNTSLAIDIGTNSEILLSSKGVIYATSAAAGPAFEGGGIESGMTAGHGAIRSVRIEADVVRLGVIGGVTPKGICGSGLVDAAASLIKAGVIEKSGRIKGGEEVSSNLSDRIKEGPGGNGFLLFKGASTGITLSQTGIRALQTAKAAIKAGIETLIRRAGITPEDIEEVYVAGAFGISLDKESLATIGLLEKGWMDKVTFTGDAALDGAILAARSGEKRKEAGEIAESARYIPLSGSPDFERAFIKNMDF
ncbi:MAG: DUF4445 domain-containing protein [Deltaproteobacteria bacterium]|nr:DUF4445 domain-containing protein [Deltaproteobacteria bacterium]